MKSASWTVIACVALFGAGVAGSAFYQIAVGYLSAPRDAALQWRWQPPDGVCPECLRWLKRASD